MIKLNITVKDLEEDKLLQTMNIILEEHFKQIESDTENTISLKKKKQFYDGTDIYGQKLLINRWKYIVDISSKVFIGQMFDIVSSGSKEDKKSLRFLNDRFREKNIDVETAGLGFSASNYGTSFLMLYNEKNDEFPSFKELDVLSTNVVYQCDINETPVLAFYVNEIKELDNGQTKKYLQVWVYLKDKMTIIKTPYSAGAFSCQYDITSFPYLTQQEKTSFIEHDFKDIPIIEFRNNKDGKGDAECVAEAICKYNSLKCKELKNIDDQISAILMFKNVRFGNDQERKEAFNIIKNEGIVAIEGTDVDVKFLSNPLDYEKTGMVAKKLSEEIEYISHCPILSSETFTQNASDPILKLKTKPMLDLARSKEVLFTKSFMKLLSIIKYFGYNYSKTPNRYEFDLSKIELEYSHSLPSNDQDMITMIANLNSAKVLAPSIALQQLSFIKNVDKYMDEMKEHNKYLVEISNEKSENMNKGKENPSNNGVNEHNLELTNSNPQTKEQMDNKKAFNLGNANNLNSKDK